MAIKSLHLCIAGSLCALGVLVPEVWFLSLLGLLVSIHAASPGDKSPRSLFAQGALFGIVYTGVVLIWFWNVLPLDWLGASLTASVSTILFSWASVVISMGSVFGGLFVGFFLLRGNHAVWNSLLFASLFALAQYVQMWVFALVTWNSESLFGPHFSAIFMGYALASFSPLLQTAALGGVYALSFLLALAGSFLYELLLRFGTSSVRKILFVGAFSCALLFMTFMDHRYPFIHSYSNASEQTISIATTATNVSTGTEHSEKNEVARRDTLRGTVRSWAGENPSPDILVFPESGKGATLDASESAAFISSVFPENKTSLIDSAILSDERGKLSQRMLLWNSFTGSSQTYQKIFLVPQGEYTPRLAELFMMLPGVKDLAERLNRAERSYVRGHVLSPIELSGIPVGALFCSDILSPSLYKTLTRNGAEVLINAASLGALHGSPLVDSLVLTIAKVRAAESGRYLVIASHEAPASIISSRGVVLARSGAKEIEILSYDVPLKSHSTPYVRFGPWILVLSLCIVTLGFMFRERLQISGTERA